MKIEEFRKPTFPVESIFLQRWSPRAFTGEEMPKEELLSLFEAARWAPSGGNSQPWRFFYARKGTPHFQRFFDFLMEGNQVWCQNASALIVITALTKDAKGNELSTHSYDSGAAWENFALQTTIKGWYAHGMAGFDYDKAKAVLKLPADYEVQAMAAVGRLTAKSVLPEHLQSREFPSDRKPLSEIVFEGAFS